MADFKLDPLTGDLDISQGLQVITNYEDEAVQRLNLAIGLNRGEWFDGVNYGMPWMYNKDEGLSKSVRYIFGGKLPDTPTFIVSTLDDYILNLSYISAVTSTYEFNKKTRVFSYTATITLLEGGTITLPAFEIETQ